MPRIKNKILIPKHEAHDKNTPVYDYVLVLFFLNTKSGWKSDIPNRTKHTTGLLPPTLQFSVPIPTDQAVWYK